MSSMYPAFPALRAIFDIDKLTWMNGVYLRSMDEDTYFETVRPYLEKAVKGPYSHREIAKIIQPRIDILNQIEEAVDFFDRARRLRSRDVSSQENEIHTGNVP